MVCAASLALTLSI